eukprot:m.1274522 g.1274522  ORF g.1274522 m.1274522 type:complete len:112 (+) comp24758_c0_seq13:4648-4983(+)
MAVFVSQRCTTQEAKSGQLDLLDYGIVAGIFQANHFYRWTALATSNDTGARYFLVSPFISSVGVLCVSFPSSQQRWNRCHSGEVHHTSVSDIKNFHGTKCRYVFNACLAEN